MFAPLSGTWEDPATGSANATLAALLVSLSGARDGTFTVSQGVEMGRPSLIRVEAGEGGPRVGGTAIVLGAGELELP